MFAPISRHKEWDTPYIKGTCINNNNIVKRVITLSFFYFITTGFSNVLDYYI